MSARGAGPSGLRAGRVRLAGILILAGLAAWAAGTYVSELSRAGDPVPVERFSHIHGLEAPAWAGGDLFVSTHTGLVRVSADGAWFEVGDAKHDLMGFRAHPSEPGVLYGSGHPDLRSGLPNPLGVLRSADAGRSWEPLALAGQVDFHALAVQESDGDVLYGFNVVGSPGLLRSLDGGRTWESLPSGALLAAGGALALEVDPGDREVVFAGTQAGLLRSADGGRRWQAVAFEGVAVTALRFASGPGHRLYAYAVDPGAGLVVSQDGGGSWARLDLVLEGGDAVGHIAVHPFDAEVLFLGSYDMDVLVSRDGGASWELAAERGTVITGRP